MRGYYHLVTGLAEYRAGRFERSVDALARAREALPQTRHAEHASLDLIEAMARRAKQPQEASDLLRRGIDRIDREVPRPEDGQLNSGSGVENWLIAQVLRREAEASVPRPTGE